MSDYPVQGPDLSGRIIQGRYQLDQKIGVGGFGSVYRATHLQMGTDVAVKVMHPSLSYTPSAPKRFALEARRSAQIRHPHTISVFDFGTTEDDLLYLVMELLEGRPLSAVLRDEGALAPDRAVHILDQTLLALEAAHQQGLVHRDLKPDNIFLMRVGDDPDFVKILDFGIAKTADQGGELTVTGVIIGTPAYMSPEQCEGKELDGRSDLYALGCVAYMLLAGRPPFVATAQVAYLIAHVQEKPDDVRRHAKNGSTIPAGLAAWVDRLLAKRPEARFASAGDARRALVDALSASPTWEKAAPRHPLTPANAPVDVATGNVGATDSVTLGPLHNDLVAPRRKARRIAVVVLGVALAALVTTAIVLSGRPPEPSAMSTQAEVVSTPEPPVPAPASPAPTPAPTPTPASDPRRIAEASSPATPPVQAPRLIRVRIESTPAGANLNLGGQLVGTTPMDATWNEGVETPAAELTLEGHNPVSIPLSQDNDGTTLRVTLTRLEPVAAPQPETPTAEPKPTGTNPASTRQAPARTGTRVQPRKPPPTETPPKPEPPRFERVD